MAWNGTIEAHGVSLWLRMRNLRRKMIENNKKFDVVVLSYPKCGRTWHRLLVGFYLVYELNEDPRSALNLEYLCGKAGVKKILYSHNGSNPTDHLPASNRLIGSPIEWEGKDVIVLTRDPHDALVSAFYHVKLREQRFLGTLSDFVATPAYGADKLAAAWNNWSRNRHLARSFDVTSYEAMHADPSAVLKRALLTMGVERLNEASISRAIEACSFENMREYERSDFFGSEILRNKSGSSDSAKVRSGRVGSSADELSDQDRKAIDARIRAHGGNPFGTMRAAPIRD